MQGAVAASVSTFDVPDAADTTSRFEANEGDRCLLECLTNGEATGPSTDDTDGSITASQHTSGVISMSWGSLLM